MSLLRKVLGVVAPEVDSSNAGELLALAERGVRELLEIERAGRPVAVLGEGPAGVVAGEVIECEVIDERGRVVGTTTAKVR